MTAPLDREAIRQRLGEWNQELHAWTSAPLSTEELFALLSALDAADAEIAALKEERKTTFEYLVPLHSLAAQFATLETLGNSVPLWAANEIKALRAENARLREYAKDLDDLCVCYRTGRRPSGALLDRLAGDRVALQPASPSAHADPIAWMRKASGGALGEVDLPPSAPGETTETSHEEMLELLDELDGIAPDLTGDLTSEEYIARMRDDEPPSAPAEEERTT